MSASSVGRCAASTASAFSKLLMACLACPCSFLMAPSLEVDVGALVGFALVEAGQHLLVVGERTGPVLEPEAHVGQALDRLGVGEVELVRRPGRP